MIINVTNDKALYTPVTDNGDGTYYIRWGYGEIDDIRAFWAEELYYKKPELAWLKKVILEWYNQQIDERIRNGFKWNEMDVWLSSENQFNYKSAYDLAVQTGGANLPVTFKFGTTDEPVYYTFTTMEELNDFYLSAMKYITDTLAEGWREKDAIDWNAYLLIE